MAPQSTQSGDGAPAPSMEQAFAAHARAFEDRFDSGDRPQLYFSPGRVNLMGAHLDYNRGPVMPTAIDRGTFIALRPRPDGRARFASTFDPRTLEVDLCDPPRQRLGLWADYPLGVATEMLRASGLHPGGRAASGFDVLFGGNLAVGAGLSSSASICVGTALALDRLWEIGGDRMSLVRAALAAERGFVGVQCGIMDPYAVGLARPGSLLWIDCKDASTAHLAFDFDALALAVVDSGVRRELAEGAFNRRVAECRAAFELLGRHQEGAECLRDVQLETFERHRAELAPELARRAEHVIREVERTFQARAHLLAGRPEEIGPLMTETHRSLRELFEVSCPELDRVIASAIGVEGVLGGRLTGAGFGGCAAVLVRRGCERDLIARVEADFRRSFGRTPRIEFYRGDLGPRAIEGVL